MIMSVRTPAPSLRSIELNLHNGASVNPVRPHDVVRHAEYDNRARDQRAVIHIGRRHRKRRRPETEEGKDDQINASESVIRDAHSARNAPRSPRVRLRSSRANASIRIPDFSANAPIQEQTASHEVRGIEPLEHQGDHVVECGRAPDID